ncbi:syntaxin-binding protein 5 isoform X2 [Orussus abietinus]|uniref:syntaxin-binding protein 5 isoform X2 n=1 Tax=Orussus abietinus TaxID=222816 RepID=UPI0006258B94|nr:syntaxin-binding protein 5 isoform X2 [Orussus abietinus]
MKKFTFKGVLDGFRSSVAQQVKPEQEIVENLRPDHFQAKKTFRHGFPHQPTAMAFDPVQRLLAIGTRSGSLRILGTPGVDAHVRHEGGSAVIQLQFLINEGALVSATADDTLHLWNFRQKIPQIVQSLKFQRERITCMHLPLQSKWLYVGTERGNIHVLHIETFVLSGYVINWNKAIEVSRKTHPGAVVHLSDNPLDLSKMLIGYETGQIVFWDLKTKQADYRCQSDEPLRSISWHHDGKQFMCSHTDGSLSTWTLRNTKPINVTHPHAKSTKDGEPEPCKSIQKVEWKLCRSSGEAYIIFSGGLGHYNPLRTSSITVIQGKTTTVLEMEQNVVDFITLCESPWSSDFQDPYAVVVLLQNDLVVIDLLTPGFPCFENPYPMDIHESAVTCCAYFADCPSDLVPAFYSVGSKSQKKTGFSEKEWPVSGGEWSPNSSSYNEIILTGHSDGSIKFWDASAGTLQVLYKLKTAKLFEKTKARSLETDDDPLAIQLIFLCPESRKLAIAGSGKHVVLFKFKKVEGMSEVVTLEVPFVSDFTREQESSPDYEHPPSGNASGEESKHSVEYNHPLKVKSGLQKRAAGFQATLICLTFGANGEQPENITALSLNSSYGLMAYGSDLGIVIVDIVQKVSLLVLSTADLGNSGDPHQRALRSPKRQDETRKENDDKARSPSVDQIRQTQQETASETEHVVAVEEPDASLHRPRQQQQEPQQETPYGTDAERRENAEDPAGDIPKAGSTTSDEEGRKNYSWKGFSLKRQLSKVDLKIKHTFASSSSQNGGGGNPGASIQKGTSVFYCNPEISSPLSPVESVGSESSPSPEQHSPSGETTQPSQEVSSTPSEGQTAQVEEDKVKPTSSKNSATKSEAVRPANLALFPSEASKPSKLKLMRGNKPKREGRLLSVPNIKYQKAEGATRDLRCEEEASSSSGVESFAGNLMRRFINLTLFFGNAGRIDKPDTSFQRSRSSSMSSLENIASETISCLTFADSYTKKSDSSALPTLWIGTSLGSVQTIVFNAPTYSERHTQPLTISTCNGSSFKLKGSILTMSFLDCNGALIPYSYEPWKDENLDGKDRNKSQGKANSRTSLLSSSQTSGSTGSDGFEDRQFVVLTSEKQARVVALPSQNCVYRQQLTDTDIVIKAEITSLKDSVCLVCYVSSGHIATYSLPSLRPLIDVDFLPLLDLSFQTTKHGIVDPILSIWGHQLFVNGDTDQIARTLCFSNKGHGLYLASPTEIQKFTVSSEFCSELTEMMGDIFIAHDMPEPPKENFFKGLFGGGSKSIDREELFGESSGRASRTIAKHIPGPNTENIRERVTSATGEISMAHQMVLERGDKLSQLEERTARMMSEADNFSQSAHGLMLKYKDKKWYQL